MDGGTVLVFPDDELFRIDRAHPVPPAPCSAHPAHRVHTMHTVSLLCAHPCTAPAPCSAHQVHPVKPLLCTPCTAPALHTVHTASLPALASSRPSSWPAPPRPTCLTTDFVCRRGCVGGWRGQVQAALRFRKEMEHRRAENQ
eukprot:2212336-Rhodomonas_salina.1